jgi:hypothetical protein
MDNLTHCLNLPERQSTGFSLWQRHSIYLNQLGFQVVGLIYRKIVSPKPIKPK